MKKYLIASHGEFASGLKSSLTVLTGMTENIQVIDAYIPGQEVDVATEVQKFLQDLPKSDVGLVFTDLAGGSVNREVVAQTQNLANVFVITSVNLPTVLAVVLDQEPVTAKRLAALVASAPVQVISTVDPDLNPLSDDDFLV